jgi:hypothetical protein
LFTLGLNRRLSLGLSLHLNWFGTYVYAFFACYGSRNLRLVSLGFTRVNANEISNMSTIVKKELVQSHDRYVGLTRDVVVEFNLV